MKIINVTPGIIPIPPNGWGAVEKIIWELHQSFLKLGHDSEILYLDDVNDYDIVHIHVANLANEAHKRGIPYYFTMHDHHAFLYGKESQAYVENLEAIKNAKKAFVPAKYLIDYFEGIPEYFSHGVNINYFQPGELKQHKILCVANNGFIHDQAEDRKGFGIAIEIAKRLNLPITIAGPNNNKSYFNKFPSDYDKLTILYDLSEDELKEVYKDHSVFLHLSKLEAGHPNLTLLEAMASGLLVVATFEKNNELSGLIHVYDINIDDLAYTIRQSISPLNYFLYKTMSLETARKLSWDNRAKELLNFYKMSFKNQLIDIYNNTKKLNIASKPDKPTFNLNFIDGAYFEILGGPDREYFVQFIDKKTNKIHHSGTIKRNCWIKAAVAYCVDWNIFVDDGIDSYELSPDFKNKRVYIALDSKALGDTLAWFPQVEEFRIKHNCKVVCSTFWNDLFKEEYPEIEFVNPGDVVDNLYAMYTIGWFYDEKGDFNLLRVPGDFRNQSLQKTCSDILGLDFKEIKPKIKMKNNVQKEKIVTIGIHGTAQTKYWNNPNGWQIVVNFLKKQGYRVVLLSREEDGYMGNKHPEGIEQLSPGPIENVIDMLQRSTLFIGISSGLSWLAWATNTPTCVISGFTYPETEFKEGIRIYTKEGLCRGCGTELRLDPGDWNWCPRHKNTDKQFECSKSINALDVISKISKLL